MSSITLMYVYPSSLSLLISVLLKSAQIEKRRREGEKREHEADQQPKAWEKAELKPGQDEDDEDDEDANPSTDDDGMSLPSSSFLPIPFLNTASLVYVDAYLPDR